MEHDGGVRDDGEARHHNKQIKWKDMDTTKFVVLNGGVNFFVDAVVYPIDVIRTRLQVQGSSMVQASFPEYKNSLDALRKIVRAEGPRGLFKGFMVSEGGYVAGHTLYYGVYEIMKQGFQDMYPAHNTKDSNANVFLTTAAAGAMADLVSCGFSVPIEIATARLQIQGPLAKPKYSGGTDVLMQIYQNEGIRGLYRGLGATLLRNVPASAVWWGSYELTKNKLHTIDLRAKLGLPSRRDPGTLHSKVENEDPLIHVISGVLAAVVSTTLVNPIDVAKTRLQSCEHLSSPILAALPSTHSTPLSTSPLTTPSPKSSSIPLATTLSIPLSISSPIVTPTPPSLTHQISHPTTTTSTTVISRAAKSLHSSIGVLTAMISSARRFLQGLPVHGKHNTASVLLMMLHEEGFRSFGKGLVPSLLIATPYSVLSILLYEEIKKWCVV